MNNSVKMLVASSRGLETKMELTIKVLSTNRKAYSEYDLLEKHEAGIVLTGSEVKSVREGRVNLKDSYVQVKNEEAFLLNCHISEYVQANQQNHDPTRTRKLLMHKGEILRLMGKVNEKGLTIIPLRIYLKGKHVKIEVALAKGRKIWGKREEKKRRAVEREIRSAMKHAR